MEIKKGALVVCDYIMNRSGIGVIEDHADNEIFFLVRIVWPAQKWPDGNEVRSIHKSAITLVSNGEVDPIRAIARLFGWIPPWETQGQLLN